MVGLPGENDSGVIEAGVNLRALERALKAVRVGARGETLVRKLNDIGAKRLISIFGRNRLPDGVNDIKRVLSEVKNVRYLEFSSQLRDYLAYATSIGYRFDLYVRRSTTLSGPLEAAVSSGRIKLCYIGIPCGP